MNDTLTFGAWLKQQMQADGLTVATLAETIQRGTVAIFRWRNGSTFPPATMHRSLAKALGVTDEEIRLRISRDRRALHAHKPSTPVSA